MKFLTFIFISCATLAHGADVTNFFSGQTISIGDRVGNFTSSGGGGITEVTNGIVGWWKFNEGSGTSATDSSGNGNTGTLIGASFSDGAISVTSASSQYVSNADINETDSLSAITVSAWAKWSSRALNQCIVGKYLVNGFGLQTDGSNANKIQFFINTGAGYYTTTSEVITNTGDWYHVAATFDNSLTGVKYRIFINGVSVGITSVGSPDAFTSNGATTAPNQVGRLSSAITRYFNGEIDDVRIYNRALTTNEFSTLYSNGRQ